MSPIEHKPFREAQHLSSRGAGYVCAPACRGAWRCLQEAGGALGGAPWVSLWCSVTIRLLALGWLECSGACVAPAEQWEPTMKRFRVPLSKEALEKGQAGTLHSGSYTGDIFVVFSDKFFVSFICELDKYCSDGLCPACALIPLHILSCVFKKKRWWIYFRKIHF